MHVHTGNGLKTSGCDSRLGSRSIRKSVLRYLELAFVVCIVSVFLFRIRFCTLSDSVLCLLQR